MIDLSLIQACAKNDASAQRELYNRYCGLFYGICYRYAYCKEDAEDMLQEGFIKIFNGIKTFECKGSFEGWMRKIIVNTCINNLVKNKKFSEHLNFTEELNIELVQETMDSKLLGKQVMKCLMSMPIHYRTIINLYAIEGYTHKEISLMLKVEEANCRTRYIRAKDMLENILKSKGIIPQVDGKVSWLNLINS